MWTDDEIIDKLKEGMRNFGYFLADTKLGHLTFMFIAGLVIMSILVTATKYFFNYNYSFLFGMFGFMTPALISVFFDKRHKDKKWW